MQNQLIYLAKCAVNGIVPEIQNIDYDLLYNDAAMHQLVSLIDCALESAGIQNSAFSKGKAEATMRMLLMEVERKSVFRELEKAQIWYMPLKGIILKHYYPKAEMREMSDNDILFDSNRAEDVRTIMEKLGYTAVQYGKGHADDDYHKPPSNNFEMHRALFLDPDYTYLNQITDYYMDVKNRLICVQGYEYRFTLEDFYIYMTAHTYKHYCGGGTGIKSLLDTYVFLKKEKDQLDWAYIQNELRKINLLDFEAEHRALAYSLFNEGQLSPDQVERLNYMYESGVYGIREHVIQHRIQKLGKKQYLHYSLHRLILPMKTVEKKYPTFYRHKILLPFLPFYRFFTNKKLARQILKWLTEKSDE